MKIQGLLKNQKIQIDPHKRGTGTPTCWDNPADEVHIDKYVNNNKDSYNIKIPINSNNPVTINRDEKQEIPEWLKKEIKDTFEDEKIRRSFVSGICRATSVYCSKIMSPEQRAKQAVGYVRKAFGLPTPRFVFRNDIKKFYAGLYFFRNHYYYVIFKSGRIYCSLNEGKWRRFSIDGKKAVYNYNKDISCTLIEDK